MRQPQSRPEPAASSQDFEFAVLEDSTVAAAVLVALDGRVLGANARMRAFLGNGTDIIDRQLTDFLVDRHDWSVWQQSQTAGLSLTMRLRGRAGNVVALRGDVRPVSSGGVRALCGVFVDINEEEQLRAAVQQSARMEALGSLTAGIAHDFNNLLTVLVGNIYLVAEELRDQPKLFEKLKSARDAGKRGAELIKQLLAFARREQLDPDNIDPCKVVAEVVPLIRRALGVRVVLETDLEADAGPIRASTAQLESVVVNLAINARDAIENKGRVAISVRRLEFTAADAARRRLSKAGFYVALSVADDGAGIPEETLGRVFEPFFSTKGDRGGTGLGLSMVRWFAEQAGGTVQIDSTVGKGTTVTLLLPQSHDRMLEAVDKTMPLSTLPTGTERVVVLAPDEALRSTIRQILEVLGYSVTFAATIDDLLALLSSEDMQLLIVDGAGKDDADLFARARAVRPALKMIVTGEGGGLRDRAPPGATVLIKPFSLADLAGSVRRTLDAAPAAS